MVTEPMAREIALANQIVTEYFQSIEAIPIIEIQRACARYYSVTVRDILSWRRTETVILPRQMAMYLSKELTLHSLPEIGRRFGGKDRGKDHSTILYAVRKIAKALENSRELRDDLGAIKRILAGEYVAPKPEPEFIPRRGVSPRVLKALVAGASTAEDVSRQLEIGIWSARSALSRLFRTGKVTRTIALLERKKHGRRARLLAYQVRT